VNAPVGAHAVALARPAESVPLGQRLAARGLDGLTLLVLPAALLVVALFVYPFLYGFWLSFQPKAAGRSPTTSASSPTRSSTARSPLPFGWRCQ
jgi:hypothetical protein